MTIALEVKNLRKAFGGVQAISDISFAIEEGSLVALIGPNGAGKSTLFNLLTNLYVTDHGSTHFFGTDLRAKSADQIASLGLIRTFQTARVFAQMSVLENVLAGAHLSERSAAWQQVLWLPAVRRDEERLRQRADALLDVLGLSNRSDDSATDLPLGSQQLLEIARALMAGPKMLLLDEPAAGLNDAETDELAKLLSAVRLAGTTVVVVEHNMSLVMSIADDVIVLDAGRLISRGTPTDIQRDERVIEAYVGRGVDSLTQAG
jgi:branched-chain amino acid transport system ATP-binding protein